MIEHMIEHMTSYLSNHAKHRLVVEVRYTVPTLWSLGNAVILYLLPKWTGADVGA